ncbi:MAG: DUF6677 family protein, partial [Planctomycetota bacterium]
MSDAAAPPKPAPRSASPGSSAAEPPPTPAEEPINLKNRGLAGFLAAALPGAGHFYQGRHVKGAIYCVCILGLFACGQALGGGQTVALETVAPGVPRGADDIDGAGDDPFRNPFGQPRRQLLQHYTAQVFAGVVAWPALLQSQRFYGEGNKPRQRI